MESLLNSIREILGTPVFWDKMVNNNNQGYSYQWDYGAMIEYGIAGILLCVVVSSVFKFLRCLVK